MSHPQAPQRQPTPSETDKYVKTLHKAAIGCLVICPLIALLPPRRLNVTTFGLTGMTAYSANYLVTEQTGKGIWQHIVRAPAPATTIPATEQANLNKELKYAKEEMQRLHLDSKAIDVGLSEREAWKQAREKEIQDDLDVGKGFGEMIMDQIYEVWNWRKKGDEEDDG